MYEGTSLSDGWASPSTRRPNQAHIYLILADSCTKLHGVVLSRSRDAVTCTKLQLSCGKIYIHDTSIRMRLLLDNKTALRMESGFA